MPLFDGFSLGLGVLNSPPLVLQQVDLIKGSASMLYRGSAIGGLVNVISRKLNSKQTNDFRLLRHIGGKKSTCVCIKKYKCFGYRLLWRLQASK